VSTEPQSEPRPPLLRGRSERWIAIAAGTLTLLAVVMVIGLFSLDHAHRSVLQEVQRTRETRLAAYGLMQASVDAETGQRGYLLTNDREFLEPYDRGRVIADQHLARLSELSLDLPELRNEYERVDTLTRSALNMLDEVLTARRARLLDDREFREALVRSKASMDDARASVSDLLQTVEHVIDQRRAEEQRVSNALFLMGSLLATLVILSVSVTLFVFRAERKSWRAAYAASEEALRRAAASDLAKNRFLAVASHDMRQPLHALTLYLTALERRVETDEARGIVAKMDRAVHSMIGMFNSLLDLARLRADVVTPEMADAPLQQVLDAVIAEHPADKVRAAPSSLILNTDARLLARLISHLTSNAIRHGGGVATIEARAVTGAAIIVVSDTGPGIAAKDQERVFEEFERLDRSSEGLGLGLPIVRKLAELLGVSLTLDSTPGEGARFILRVPKLASEPPPAPPSNAEQAELTGVAVLIVDDDTLAREAISGHLSDLGADVRAFADGDEAQAALTDGYTPRLLVLDLRIRGELHGLDIAKRISARLDPAPRTIMVTGDTSTEILEALLSSGYAWLIKPVDPQDLAATAAAQIKIA
jgi:signal transduction histidine kinase/CheY-like chemotaxis protein